MGWRDDMLKTAGAGLLSDACRSESRKTRNRIMDNNWKESLDISTLMLLESNLISEIHSAVDRLCTGSHDEFDFEKFAYMMHRQIDVSLSSVSDKIKYPETPNADVKGKDE